MKAVPTYIIATLILLCGCVSLAEVSLNLKEQELSERASAIWSLMFIILTAIWVQKDSALGKFDKPYDFGLFLYLFLPVLLPYYLVKTRGSEGVVTFLGFVCIHYLPFVSGLIAYAYFS